MVPGARGELEPSGTMTSLFGCANSSYDVLPGQHLSFLSAIVIRITILPDVSLPAVIDRAIVGDANLNTG
ncbi:hypothetical protein NLI96_g12780 [Meripilus lineatus]|uniref:Uncharacterized protein n=1 Tax=Meripilus lineatus TaxID=2056292 RepID=A0AAD5URN2_9APHY|nr:hypothetical protein NLI96_g12780 [Physisporinus lineatus]